MSLHGISSVSIAVPDVAAVERYYEALGLERASRGVLRTTSGEEQLRLVDGPSPRLISLTVGADDAHDLEAVDRRLTAMGLGSESASAEAVTVVVPDSDVKVVLRVGPRISLPQGDVPVANRPGLPYRVNRRADAIERSRRVQPRRLGHVGLGVRNLEQTARFFTEGLGFKVSDSVPGVAEFLRCSPDHHNLFLVRSDDVFLHHTAWEVEDADDVGRGAVQVMQAFPESHVWGFGRHHIGSNYYWFLRDPAGHFTEFYADLDQINDDDQWSAESFRQIKGTSGWGPAAPEWFLRAPSSRP